ncbi:MAG: hypothetical protein M3P51_04230 [Chloroflexota bacterium]|nr:hypothetical protein [Chloroflexota bacterium]
MARLFMYLDEYKMYSVSSQIFEGLTEEIVQYSERESQDTERQKGPLGSGRLLADIVTDTQGRRERRFLFDYAYTIFEKRLVDDGRVLEISEAVAADPNLKSGEYGFVRITGPMALNDLAAIQRTAKDFNKIMAAMQYVSGMPVRDTMAALLKEEIAGAKGQRRSELQKQLKELYSATPEPAIDAQFLEQLTYLLEFGFGDHLEAQISFALQSGTDRMLYTAVLDRESLRESASSLVKKYSRHSECPFTIFGVMTQRSRIGKWNEPARGIDESFNPGGAEHDNPDLSSAGEPKHLKEALGQMTEHIGNIEDTFFGRLPNEVIVDPIAIYREV